MLVFGMDKKKGFVDNHQTNRIMRTTAMSANKKVNNANL